MLKSGDGQTEKKTDSPIERGECLTESPVYFLRRSLDRRWIGDTPVRRHRLPRPQRTNLFRRVVTDGKNKVEWWRAWLGELIPGLAAKVG